MSDNKKNEYAEQDIELSVDDLSGVSGGGRLEMVNEIIPGITQDDTPGVSPGKISGEKGTHVALSYGHYKPVP